MSWIDRLTNYFRQQSGGKNPLDLDVGKTEVNPDTKQILDDTVQSFVDLKNPKDIDILLEALADNEFDVWYHAGRGLVKLGGSAVPQLLSCLHGTTRLRRRVIELLGDIDDSRTIGPLISILQSQDQVEVELAAKALSKLNIRMPEALEPLFKEFHRSNNRVMRTNIDKALFGMGDYAVEPLVKIMNGPDRELAIKAVVLLGRLKSKLAVKSLVDHINDDHKQMRVNALATLAEMKDTRAINPLIQLLTDTDWQIREAAVSALCNMGEIALLPLKKVQKNAREDPRVRAFAQELLLDFQRKTSEVMKKQNNPGVIDIRSDADRRMELEGRFPLNKEDERIAQQLTQLIKQLEKNGEYSAKTKKEAMDIGNFLCENGGNLRMQRIAARVVYLGGSNRQLELWWNGICGWMA